MRFPSRGLLLNSFTLHRRPRGFFSPMTVNAPGASLRYIVISTRKTLRQLGRKFSHRETGKIGRIKKKKDELNKGSRW